MGSVVETVGWLQVGDVLEAGGRCGSERDNECSQGVEAALASAVHGQLRDAVNYLLYGDCLCDIDGNVLSDFQ